MPTTNTDHQPVLLKEAIDLLDVHMHNWYIDATFGSGGHSRLILAKGGRVLGLDFDQETIEAGQNNFVSEIAEGRLILVRENFAEIQSVWHSSLAKTHQERPSGILFDFGTSTQQLMDSSRGLSFSGDGPLDMRLDDRLGVTAADLIQALPEKDLARLFSEYGGEHQAKNIAHVIKQTSPSPRTTQELVTCVEKAGIRRESKLHPATKVFQALRIAVNLELENIELVLPLAFDLLEPEANLVTIAFHEGEDRLVKHFFNDQARQQKTTLLTKKPVVPTQIEIESNPRSRSAKLRAIRKNPVWKLKQFSLSLFWVYLGLS